MSAATARAVPAKPTTATDNPHTRLVDELKLKRPECVSALRALVNRKIAERKLGRAA